MEREAILEDGGGKELTELRVTFNPNNKWAKMSRWQRRYCGFKTYFACAFLSLWQPEAVDYVLFKELRDQFIVN